MHFSSLRFGLLLLFGLLSPSCSSKAEDVSLEVITHSTPCSVTCGLGIKTQTLCLLDDSKKALEEVQRKNGTQAMPQPSVSNQCRERVVRCREVWRCGLLTMTVTVGDQVTMDCVGEVSTVLGSSTWRVSWRYVPGLISSDDSLFRRWKAPLLERVILDPVKEEDAGTYRCNVQDASFRRVKRIYWGIRVLPRDVLNLDYESTLAEHEEDMQVDLLEFDTRGVLLHAALSSVVLAAVWVGFFCLFGRRIIKTGKK